MADSDFHVLIVGAGATGLLIAQGLKKAGIRATIYERYSREEYEERAGKWTVALHWSIPFIEACVPLEISAKLKSTETHPWTDNDSTEAAYIPLVNGLTGDLMAKMPMPSGRRVSRGKLRNLLSTGIDIHFGMKLSEVRSESAAGEKPAVTVLFNGGSVVAKGSVIVGADGARSVVRNYLVGKEAGELQAAESLSLNVFATFTAEQALFIRNNSHLIGQACLLEKYQIEFYTNRLSVADVVDPEKPETWVFQYSFSNLTKDDPPADEEEQRKLFKTYMATYCEPYKSIGLWVTDDTPISAERFNFWGNIVPWDNRDGKITIAGDAAHPMLPFRAQGLNNAAEDAKLYVDAIKGVVYDNKDLKSTIDAYDESSYTRGKTDIISSHEQMKAYHNWDIVMNGPLMKSGGYGKPR
ncbi:uncharacterized protein TRUGW13939_09102 [Talaromyces rugulosus]|uniref:FAD-binding domain-containing protein n=1 Tax=Talaromyces rugulosus TaxID=121627 RepID=A0A7H8R6V9_TALRU|nr:uncharacterized protein TRUGW13939_09102 [Talaromyces rugulosus]QKX61946.1 hypothetical protein TRUGW13939_09102 [Talaromyces rugulosus]